MTMPSAVIAFNLNIWEHGASYSVQPEDYVLITATMPTSGIPRNVPVPPCVGQNPILSAKRIVREPCAQDISGLRDLAGFSF